MKKYLGIIFLVLFSLNLQAQDLKTSQDSIQVFYDNIFKVMKNGYLYKESVNWEEIESKIKNNLNQYSNFNKSLKEVSKLFDLTNADHSRLYFQQQQISGNFESPTQDDFSEQWIKKYKENPTFNVKVIDGNIGYILMPGIMFTDYTSRNIHKSAQSMYDKINEIKSSNNIKGWILDLRFNTGGNCEPMLLALYDFLGDNDIWGVLDINKEIEQKIKLTNGKYKINSKKSSYINSKGNLLEKSKVAVITNIATGSSGEITALAFKGRKNTIFIGEPTNGKTTSNVQANLPFGAFMTLTVGLDCDRNGNYYKKIIPDIAVVEKDNFDKLLLDGNIQEAIKFISEQE